MLIITRRRGQATDIIDRNTGQVLATVLVMHVMGGEVRLGFEAADHIRFVRDNARKRDDIDPLNHHNHHGAKAHDDCETRKDDEGAPKGSAEAAVEG